MITQVLAVAVSHYVTDSDSFAFRQHCNYTMQLREGRILIKSYHVEMEKDEIVEKILLQTFFIILLFCSDEFITVNLILSLRFSMISIVS